ncbi:hypothetical protein O181_067234 [Austropuccinia psidii MF-1]|uniref:GAG-pre-integrase domain-containing protein n=1 Tax=Austropuccinia psidii MF-1 TaxID=1389203 RepID=A0A9Q3EUI5_9BASI|nr:hypothetical protein [Austropuccinia psidii MF-1]
MNKGNNHFQLSQSGQVFLGGHIINKLMIVTFNLQRLFLPKGGEYPPWHQMLGQPANQVLKSLGFGKFDEQLCDVCARGKITTLPFKGYFTKAAEPLQFLHLEIVVTIRLPSK